MLLSCPHPPHGMSVLIFFVLFRGCPQSMLLLPHSNVQAQSQYVDRYKRFSNAVTVDVALGQRRPSNANTAPREVSREYIAGDATPDLIWANL